jgi:hypothetical protein
MIPTQGNWEMAASEWGTRPVVYNRCKSGSFCDEKSEKLA